MIMGPDGYYGGSGKPFATDTELKLCMDLVNKIKLFGVL